MNINFYVGQGNTLQQRLYLACKLIAKARTQQLTSYIYTDSLHSSERMDEVLWTYSDVSFIPHAIIPTEEKLPVLIGYDSGSCPETDFLINLSNTTPSFLSKFNRVAEIIDQDAEILDAGRKRYAEYRKQGYNLNYYQL